MHVPRRPCVVDMLEMTAECGNPPASTSTSRKVGVTSAEGVVHCQVSPTQPLPFLLRPSLQAPTVRVTDEERRMLESEGVYLPHDMPLTKVRVGGSCVEPCCVFTASYPNRRRRRT